MYFKTRHFSDYQKYVDPYQRRFFAHQNYVEKKVWKNKKSTS